MSTLSHVHSALISMSSSARTLCSLMSAFLFPSLVPRPTLARSVGTMNLMSEIMSCTGSWTLSTSPTPTVLLSSAWVLWTLPHFSQSPFPIHPARPSVLSRYIPSFYLYSHLLSSPDIYSTEQIEQVVSAEGEPVRFALSKALQTDEYQLVQ